MPLEVGLLSQERHYFDLLDYCFELSGGLSQELLVSF